MLGLWLSKAEAVPVTLGTVVSGVPGQRIATTASSSCLGSNDYLLRDVVVHMLVRFVSGPIVGLKPF